jgi:N-acyl-L-homoserine lactone synthetase
MKVIRKGEGEMGQAAALRAMFAARKEVFVDLLAWDVSVLAGRYEVDQFDDQYARYLIIAEDDGRHRGSVRLLPTTRPHLLGSIFAALCTGPVPTGPEIFEITRFCLDRHQTAIERGSARNMLVTELVVSALTSGIRTFTGVAEWSWYRQIMQFGWACRPLGDPQTVNGRKLMALAIDIDGQTLGALARTGMCEPVADHRLPRPLKAA